MLRSLKPLVWVNGTLPGIWHGQAAGVTLFTVVHLPAIRGAPYGLTSTLPLDMGPATFLTRKDAEVGAAKYHAGFFELVTDAAPAEGAAHG